MRRLLFVVASVALVAAACSGDDSTTVTTVTTATTTTALTTTTAPPTTAAPTTSAAPTTTTVAPDTTTVVPDGAIVIDSIDFDSGFIVLRNVGAAEYDLTGHFVCNRPSYVPLPALVLAAGDTVEIETTGLGVNAGNGELGVYTSSDFGSSNDIIRYVEWGNAGHGRSGTAIAAGVWVDGDFVDNGEANIQSTGDDPVSSADWSAG